MSDRNTMKAAGAISPPFSAHKKRRKHATDPAVIESEVGACDLW